MKLYFVRHGETDWNLLLKLQGREDIPLNENGIKQAEHCGKKLKGLKIGEIISSPLSRAKDTATIIAKHLNFDRITVDEAMIERDFGQASGMTYEEKKQRFKDSDIAGLESFEQMRDRMLEAIDRYVEEYKGEDLLIVSHGGTINCLLTALSGGKIGSGKTRLKNTCINVLNVDDRKKEIIAYNLEPDEFARLYLLDN